METWCQPGPTGSGRCREQHEPRRRDSPYFGQPPSGVFFWSDFLIAYRQSPSTFSSSGSGSLGWRGFLDGLDEAFVVFFGIGFLYGIGFKFVNYPRAPLI